MTFLADVEIRSILNNMARGENERIEITPAPDDAHIGPCSIDLRLGEEFARLRPRPRFVGFGPLDPARFANSVAAQVTWYRYYKANDEKGIRIRPNETVMALTKERVRLPRTIFGLVTGRSSYSRIGLEVHLTQELRQPGHAGHILLQLKNNAPFSIKLYPGMRIAQIMLARLGEPCTTGYDQASSSKYKGEADGIATKWYLDPELQGRPIISRMPQVEQLLNASLMILAAISVWSLYDVGGRTRGTFGLLLATFVVLLLRVKTYFRVK